MTGKQNLVLWGLLILITLRLFTTDQWSELWGTLSTKSSAPSSSAPKANTPSTTPYQGGIPVGPVPA
jgi:hypothetical protein